MNIKKGFTLIELLIVIAIIAILASIVLVSFPSIASKARDSKAVSAMTQARKIMMNFGTTEANYLSFTNTFPSEMGPINTDIYNNTSPKTNLTVIKKLPGSAVACMFTKLTSKDNYWYCVDSTGKFGYTSTDPASLTGCGGVACCTATNAICPTVVAEP